MVRSAEGTFCKGLAGFCRAVSDQQTSALTNSPAAECLQVQSCSVGHHSPPQPYHALGSGDGGGLPLAALQGPPRLSQESRVRKFGRVVWGRRRGSLTSLLPKRGKGFSGMPPCARTMPRGEGGQIQLLLCHKNVYSHHDC